MLYRSLIERKHVVQDSEHLQTVFVAVPASASKDFQAKYERLTDVCHARVCCSSMWVVAHCAHYHGHPQMVVPRSGQKVAEDPEYELWSVTVFKRVIDDFKNAARESKFIVRDFVYDPEMSAKSENEKKVCACPSR